ncbi:Crp/Fnr family transcriptional regulator [Allorhizocola rhizosphaerae]|uniref:Crp/Fnr family transcriptional regulator n=1 Tax=Allorhizocola rhizosphaerae TaxID=1872709 RepID=UPI000E3EBF47|nr:Crp/Fnr family transcriptional regulator [Allorhizocola rhizosphaerae]
MNENARWPIGTLMHRLPPRARNELLAILTPAREFKTGEILIRQGDEGLFVYLLRAKREGRPACVKVTAQLDNGSETLLAVRIHGDLVGEMSVLRGVPRNATVTACADTLAYAITKDTFRAYLTRCPEAWAYLYDALAGRLEWSNLRRQEFGSFPVPVRLARVMLDLANRHGIAHPDGLDLGVRLSQMELGLLIGAREDAVSQAMRQLREAGLAAPRYRSVVITDRVALASFASAV